jgi:predicted permease
MATDELRFLCAAFGRLVLLYPPEFRRLFAADMVSHFRRSAGVAYRRGGRTRLYVFGLTTFLGVAGAAMAERARRRREPRTARRGDVMNGWNQDLRLAFRALRKTPAFTALAVLTLGLGIAVNTTIFSLVSTLLFSELPLKDPDGFVFLWAVNERAGERRSALSLPEVAEIRREARSLSAVVFAVEESLLLDGEGGARRVAANRVTADFFDVWGVDCVLGRCFLAGEDRPGAPPVAVVSHGFWERQLGSDAQAIGTLLRLDGLPTTIVGVASPKMEFGGLSEFEVWIPIGVELETAPRDERVAFTQARLEPGVSPEEAGRELEAIAGRLEREHPESAGYGFRVSSVEDELLNEDDRSVFVVLGLSVALVLLIACANVANMLMARASARAREIALQLALGARRSRILRQFGAEALVLSMLAGLVGLVLARALLDFLVYLTAGRTWILSAAEIDRRVLAFTLGISLAMPLLFALIPSLRASRPDLAASLKEGARAGTGMRARSGRGFLMASQVAMALTLMITTALLARTIHEFKTRHLGFETEGVAAATIELSHVRHERDVRQFYEALMARASETSGSRGVSVVSPLPLTTGQRRSFLIEGAAPPGKDEEAPSAYRFVAGPGYLQVMGIPILAGRDFSSSDREGSAPVALLNKSAADRYFAGEMPIGRRIRLSSDEADRWIEVVGVVGDVVHLDDELPRAPQFYLPFAQAPSPDATVVARTTEPALFAESLRAEVDALGADDALAGVRTMKEISEEELANADAITVLFGIFAGFALIMASMGIYAVMSYAVSQRERELSIRLALGAKRNDVLRMVVLQGAKLSMAGMAVGLVGALLLSRLLDGAVFGMSLSHPATYALVTAALGAVALLSNYAPARRATRLDPIAALRAE